MVVPDAYRNLALPEFRQVVLDRRVGMRSIAKDILDKKLDLSGVSKLMLLVGRADVLNNEDPVWVLERLITALREVEFEGETIIIGPLPEPHDKRWMCTDCNKAREDMFNYLRCVGKVCISFAGQVICDQRGVIPQLFLCAGALFGRSQGIVITFAIVVLPGSCLFKNIYCKIMPFYMFIIFCFTICVVYISLQVVQIKAICLTASECSCFAIMGK